ncbi:MAG: hypothetical protein Q3982_08630 [Phoenicibacter congonensis]|uniref:Class III signal peptide-containing protein n=1 Tax=Phoenicibacter congonensis TaxID=1944646 RepID=A0AA43RK23_9ACTN|nr:hypothetical protein [Phoenicibacter congonensis]
MMNFCVLSKLKKMRDSAQQSMIECVSDFQSKLTCQKGQGTTEYAILVGVLVVIAILAIGVFKDKLQELWNAISSGINGL